MRVKITDVVDEGGDLQQANCVDQSPGAHLDTFFEVAISNAGRIFRVVEFE